MDTLSPVNAVLDSIISKLEGTFSESAQLRDTPSEDSEHASEGNHIGNCDVGEGNLRGGFELQETKLEIQCLKECSTFPYPSSSSDKKDDASPSKQSLRQNYTCLVATPKLVSAMKGSREKEWGSQMKLTVKWASDVYDPVVTLLSHIVKSKKQHKSRIKKSEKKNVMKGQKVNCSKGGSSKDKLYRYKWLHARDEVFEAYTELDDLNVVDSDSYFRTGYLKTSVSKVHWPIGEAL